MVDIISKRYANALFEIAKEKNKIYEFEVQLNFILNCIKEDKEFLNILKHPHISYSQKFDIFEKAFKNNVYEEILGFIYIIIKKNRENELIDILKMFLDIINKYKNTTTAFIYSATRLTTNQLEDIKQKLSEKLKKDIVIDFKQKPELIAGLIINIDGKVIDNSIKKSLEDIKKNLLSK